MSIAQATEQGGSFLSRTPERIFTPESFTSDERLMVDIAADFCRNEILSVSERLDKQEAGLMQGLIRKAGELGLCGVDAPEAYGGLGLGKNLAARILEQLSMDASFSVTYGVTTGIAVFGLIAYGTEEQKRRYLPKLTSGEWLGGYALSEPNSGSDALSMTTRAEDRGDHWVLNGTKMWISNAQWADFFLVMAKVDGEQVSAFLVERGYPGVSVSREEHKLGLKGSSTARLVLENAVVPKEGLLHEVGKGHYVALNSLNIGRFKLAAMCMGPARYAISESSKYATDRKQFGQSISEFGLIRQKFADMAAHYFACESMLYRTGSNVDRAFVGIADTVEARQSAAQEFAVECSACKVFASEAQARIVDEALQVYGGYGFTEEFPLARLYRDSRISKIYEGTNEINRIFLSDRLAKRANDGLCSLEPSGDSFLSELCGKAYKLLSKDQEVLGAVSDLTILHYAEQSARLRASQVGGLAAMAHERFANWANLQGAGAYQRLTGESVTLPAPFESHTEELAEAVYSTGGPMKF